jgi:hypothetical protein
MSDMEYAQGQVNLLRVMSLLEQTISNRKVSTVGKGQLGHCQSK